LNSIMRAIALTAIVLLTACGPRKLTPEEQKQVDQLKAEVAELQAEINKAEELEGRGLIGALAGLRVQTLKNTEALINQRIAALETGAALKAEPVSATEPDPARVEKLEQDLAAQDETVAAAERRAANAGGLIGAVASMTVETERSSAAGLRAQLLAAKYGLPSLAVADARVPEARSSDVAVGEEPANVADSPAGSIVTVGLLSKRLTKNGYEDFVVTDLEFAATGLDKPARAIKGVLLFNDLFGEPQFQLEWTINDPIEPGQVQRTTSEGFEYNQFKDQHQWVANTAAKDMRLAYRVSSIIYADGTRRDFDGE
jgi:hypothetical protein